MRISGSYAYDDGTGLSNQYVSFENGYFTEVDFTKKLSYMENSFWGYEKSIEKSNKHGIYSVNDGHLTVSGNMIGTIEIKEDCLYYKGKKYSKVESFNETHYSSIAIPDGKMKTITYEAKEYAVPVNVNRPIPAGELTASSAESWLSSVWVENSVLHFRVNETKVDRDGTVVLKYTNAENVSLSVSQRPSTFIKLSAKDRVIAYAKSSQSLSYHIENPLSGSQLTVTSNVEWVKNIAVNAGTGTILFDVDENTGRAPRIAHLTFSYTGAADVDFMLTQNKTTTVIVLAPSSQSCDYVGGDFSTVCSIENPRQGVSLTAVSQVSWITNVAVSGNTVSYKVAENNSGDTRTGTISFSYGSFASKTMTVTQDWSATQIRTAPTSQTVPHAGGDFIIGFSVENPRKNVSLMAASQVSWITNVAVSGNTVSYKVAANNSAFQRSGTIRLSYGSYATCAFTVTQSGKPVQSLSLNTSSIVLHTEASETLIATVDPADATLSWSSSNTSVATVSSSGMVTGVAKGTATIKVAATDGSGKSATCSVEVGLYVTGITLNKTALTLNEGQTETLSANVAPEDAYDKTLTWSSSNTSVATVDQTGKVTAVSKGTATITATAKDGSGKKATCSVTVIRPVTSITLDKTLLTIYNGKTETLTATVTPSTASYTDVTWSSSNTSVATVSSSGMVTGVAKGTATITAAAKDGSGKSATCSVDVKQYVTGITLNKSALTLKEGQTQTLSANVAPDNANDKTLTWSSSNTSVATVSTTGVVSGVASGTTTITATANDGSGKKATCSVIVATDLSSSKSANCYIVSSAGGYKFKTVKGNSSTSVGSVFQAEVLWESFGTSTAPSKGSIISNVSYSDNYIAFATPSTLKNGNAVIAAKDASGNILWSWHIWVCSGYNPSSTAQTYYNSAGKMMDRNLGATSATPGNVGSLGLLYQWGRKDPFLGSSSISSNSMAASTLSWPSAESSTSSNGTIAYSVKNPTTFIKYNSSNGDWYYTGSSSTDNTRWQTIKTIYDPCPPGWKVPAGGSSGVWYKAVGSSSTFSYTWNSTNKGMNFSAKFGSSSTIWYPAAGHLGFSDGSLKSVGLYGYWWSCTPSGSYAYSLYLTSNGNVGTSSGSYRRADGFPVRCLQE